MKKTLALTLAMLMALALLLMGCSKNISDDISTNRTSDTTSATLPSDAEVSTENTPNAANVTLPPNAEKVNYWTSLYVLEGANQNMKEDYDFYESIETAGGSATFTLYFVHRSEGVRGLLQFTTEHYSFNEERGNYHTGRDEKAEFFIVVDQKQKIKVPLGMLEVDRRASFNDKLCEWRISKQELPTDGMIFQLMFSDYGVKTEGITSNDLIVCDYVASWNATNVSPYSYSLFILPENSPNNRMIYISFSGEKEQSPDSAFTTEDVRLTFRAEGIIQSENNISIEHRISGTQNIWKISDEHVREIMSFLTAE